MYRLILLITACYFLIILQSCSEEQYVCTDEFVTHTVTVLSPNGEPADSVQIEIKEKGSQEIYPCDEYLCDETQPGEYIIMHDGFLGEISGIGEKILIKGTKENLQFEEEFTFRSGKCHIEKLTGPDTVSLALE